MHCTYTLHVIVEKMINGLDEKLVIVPSTGYNTSILINCLSKDYLALFNQHQSSNISHVVAASLVSKLLGLFILVKVFVCQEQG